VEAEQIDRAFDPVAAPDVARLVASNHVDVSSVSEAIGKAHAWNVRTTWEGVPVARGELSRI
jgi:hypothetical protein